MPDGCYWACDDCRANESVEKTPVKDSSSEEGKVENNSSSKISSSSSFQPLAPISLGPWVFGTRQLELKGPPFEWNCVPNPDPSIPDASLWTSEDVQSYFSRLGFEEQAALLRHNVIDTRKRQMVPSSCVFLIFSPFCFSFFFLFFQLAGNRRSVPVADEEKRRRRQHGIEAGPGRQDLQPHSPSADTSRRSDLRLSQL
jgi:hypothetical protein